MLVQESQLPPPPIARSRSPIAGDIPQRAILSPTRQTHIPVFTSPSQPAGSHGRVFRKGYLASADNAAARAPEDRRTTQSQTTSDPPPPRGSFALPSTRDRQRLPSRHRLTTAAPPHRPSPPRLAHHCYATALPSTRLLSVCLRPPLPSLHDGLRCHPPQAHTRLSESARRSPIFTTSEQSIAQIAATPTLHTRRLLWSAIDRVRCS